MRHTRITLLQPAEPAGPASITKQATEYAAAGQLRRNLLCLVCVPQVLELLLDRKAADARHAREVAARDAELTRLQDYIDSELSELQQRQAQVGEGLGCAGLVCSSARHRWG